MKYFGLDLGEKTIGVAISLSGIIASNFQTIRFGNNDYDFAATQVIKLAKENQIDCIVLGLPKHMNNDIGIKGQTSLEFQKKLQDLSDIKVVTWDERLSTKSALQILSNSNKKYDKQRALKDEVAAQVILQGYLDYIN